MRWATRGTIIAAQEALIHGFAVNLSGGYHHAKPTQGEGFSIYADVGIAVASRRNDKLIAETDRVELGAIVAGFGFADAAQLGGQHDVTLSNQ